MASPSTATGPSVTVLPTLEPGFAPLDERLDALGGIGGAEQSRHLRPQPFDRGIVAIGTGEMRRRQHRPDSQRGGPFGDGVRDLAGGGLRLRGVGG